MAKRVLRIRHNTAQANAFLGKEGELTIDLTTKAIRVHDGVTAGGTETARGDLQNVTAATNTADGKMSATKIAELEANTSKNASQDLLITANTNKLATIETGATADQSDAEIKTAYENNADTNAFTDALLAILNNQSGTNTGDESAATTSAAGIVELATLAEADAGTDGTRAVTPAALANILANIALKLNAAEKAAANGVASLNAGSEVVQNALTATTATSATTAGSIIGQGALATLNSVDTAQIDAGAVANSELATSAVSSVKIQTNAVSADKIGTDQVASRALAVGFASMVTLTINNGNTSTLSQGIYMVISPAIDLEMWSGTSWISGGFMSGVLWTDGSNFRFNNSSGALDYVYYRRLN